MAFVSSSSTKFRNEDIPKINYDQLVYKENSIISIFKCGICNKVPVPSVVRLSCEHIFCKDHIIQELKRQYLQNQNKYSVNINEVKKKQDRKIQDHIDITCPKCNQITQLKTETNDYNQGNNEYPVKIILPFDENISKIVDTLEVYCLGNENVKLSNQSLNYETEYNSMSESDSCHWCGPRNKLRKHLLECDNIYICNYCKYAMKANHRYNHEKKCENIFKKRQSIVSLSSLGNINDVSVNNLSSSVSESNDLKSLSSILEKTKEENTRYYSCVNASKGCPLTHILINEYINHIWNCEYQEKNLEWVIKKHKYIELNHKKQIKLLEQKSKEQLQKIEKLEETILLLKQKYYLLTILSLDPNDKAVQLELSENNTYVKHIGLIDNECWASVRSNMPISNRHQVYYYEVKIIFRRSEWPNFGAIGYCTRNMELSNRPGYSKNSSGYCNYTGDHYEHGNWTHYGPSYEVGDVVGCCINFIDKKVFYTKNGKNLGMTGIAIPDQPIFVCIGLYTGSEMKVNFGQEPFVFDIEGYKKSLKVAQRQQKLNSDSSNEVVE
ncbi:hypothetical protein LY90DRAFT_674999, partial [Neocallimastix californiae]